MSNDKNIQTVKDFFAAVGRGDREAILALAADDIEWIIPGKDWPLAGTRHGHAGLADLLETASKSVETSTEPREFMAQGDRVLVAGFVQGTIKATNKTFEDDWVFAITVRDGRMTHIPHEHERCQRHRLKRHGYSNRLPCRRRRSQHQGAIACMFSLLAQPGTLVRTSSLT